MIQAELEGKTRKQRQQKKQEYGGKLIGYETGWVNASEVLQISEQLRTGKHAVIPFNWEDEFLEVFERENPGFDCIIGNPPFLGGKKISTNFGNEYLAWLLEHYPESSGNADLVAQFFRRAHELLREGGSFGLIATNTIAQGDTRSTGLRWICEHGGTIYNARKRVKWAGQAAVVVSVIHVYKGLYKEVRILDGKEVPFVSAFLFPKGGNNSPNVLLTNANKSFIGCDIKGLGFTFNDTDSSATPIAEMHRLIAKYSRNQERISPYIGGEEVNGNPTHKHHRYVINFGEMSEIEAQQYPDLLAIVEEKVKPERKKKSKELAQYPWWKFWRTRQRLYGVIAECDRVLVCSLHSEYLSFAFLPANSVFSHALAVFADEGFANFGLLQSRVHEIWARFFGSSLETRFRYTPSDCFETFPFPENWETDRTLEAIGKQYYEFRAELMIRNNQGLTETYNRFHDPNEFDPDILRLRQLHEEMDRAVLAAYGWSDLQPQCEFLLDYEDDEDDEENTNKRQRKKPWRYRWNEETHDEVLARLLDLNQKRYEQEILGGASAQKAGKSKKGDRKKSRKAADTETPSIFDS